jgi:hypothetical protein
MKKQILIVCFLIGFFLFSGHPTKAQCSICTKTAQQLGEKPAKGLNTAILYLAATPFLIAGYVYFRWKKSNNSL